MDSPAGPRPLPLLSGTNLYQYARQNPTRLVDPSGEGPITLGVCVAIGAGITAKQILDARAIGKDVQAIQDQIDALQAQHDAECDPAKQLQLFAQIQELHKQLTARRLKQQAQSQAAAVAALATTACVPLIAIGP